MSTNSDIEAFLRPVPRQTFTNPPHILFIGAGSRGHAYAEAALDSTNSVVAAVAEPVAYKRKEFGDMFIWGDGKQERRAEMEFNDWKDWVKYEKVRRTRERAGEKVERGIDAVFVCVLDDLHEEVVCGIAPLGVHICCEKPMSTRLESCINMYNALKASGTQVNESVSGNAVTERKDQIFGICHILRYSPHNMLLKHLVLEKDIIGDILSIEHVEPVGWWHFSHSYVRGNWRKESKTAPSLLTKSCHDLDFLFWLLCSPPSNAAPDTPPHLPSHITSTGSLKFFRKQRKPPAAGNATNCLSCPHEKDCIYSAKKIYKDRHLDSGNTGWPVKIINPEIEDMFKTTGKEAAEKQLMQNLAEDYTDATPTSEIEARPWFGRCVFESDNNVCDDQCVTITWDDDPLPSTSPPNLSTLRHRYAKTAQFHMIAFTEKICERRGRIYGTKGEISYDSTTISVHDFATDITTVHKPHFAGGGHGGGDEGLARQFLKAVDAVENLGMRGAEAQRTFLGCDVEEAFRSHAAVFAAEKARTEERVVRWGEWWEESVEGALRG